MPCISLVGRCIPLLAGLHAVILSHLCQKGRVRVCDAGSGFCFAVSFYASAGAASFFGFYFVVNLLPCFQSPISQHFTQFSGFYSCPVDSGSTSACLMHADASKSSVIGVCWACFVVCNSLLRHRCSCSCLILSAQ